MVSLPSSITVLKIFECSLLRAAMCWENLFNRPNILFKTVMLGNGLTTWRWLQLCVCVFVSVKYQDRVNLYPFFPWVLSPQTVLPSPLDKRWLSEQVGMIRRRSHSGKCCAWANNIVKHIMSGQGTAWGVPNYTAFICKCCSVHEMNFLALILFLVFIKTFSILVFYYLRLLQSVKQLLCGSSKVIGARAPQSLKTCSQKSSSGKTLTCMVC